MSEIEVTVKTKIYDDHEYCQWDPDDFDQDYGYCRHFDQASSKCVIHDKSLRGEFERLIKCDECKAVYLEQARTGALITKHTLQRDDAVGIVKDCCENGTGVVRVNYIQNNEVGEVAKMLWDDSAFTLGIEYGMLIALELFYKPITKG